LAKYSLLVPGPITANFHTDSVIVLILQSFQKMECLCQMLKLTRFHLSFLVTETVTFCLSQMPVGIVWVLGVLN